MSAKQAYSQYVPNRDACTDVKQCRDELQREISTRKRLYDRWVAEGKLTETEADQRMRQMMGAMLFLDQFVPAEAELKLEIAARPF